MHETYEFTFTFEFFDDIIIYKTKRECSSKGYAVSYAKDWVKKFGFKYGKCISVEIQKCVDTEMVIISM